jgi:tetratricopeptide (TPR) repeat protein
MKKTYLAALAVAFFLISSCQTVRKQAKTASAPAKTVAVSATDTDTLSQQNQLQFESNFIDGLKQAAIGNPQLATALFSKCLEINPNSAAAMFELAKIYSGNGDLTSSSLLLEKAAKIDPDNRWYKLMLAQIYQQGKQYLKAAALYQELSAGYPDNQGYLYMTAAQFAAGGKYDEAIRAYNVLEQKIGINDQISSEKEQVFLAAGKPQEAEQELKKLIDSNPGEPKYYGLLADFYLSQKNDADALKYYNKILEIDPENGFVLFSLASYYHQKDDKEKAWEYLKKGFENKTVEVDTKIQYYLMLTSDSDSTFFTNEQIGQLVNILMKTNSDDYRVYSVYAEYLIREGKLAEAREELRKVLESQKDSYLVWERLLLISNDLQDFKSVYSDASQAIELFPNQAVLYGLKAVACLQLEKYQEALEVLKEGEPYLLNNQPLKIQFDLYRAEANYKLNNVQDAFKAFDEVISLDPQNWMAMNNYAYYLSLRAENLDKAEQLSSKAVRANPDNPTYLDTYAWVLFMQKDYKLARFYMETALKNGGDKNGVIIEHYGDILFMLGDKQEAMAQWKKALATGEGSHLLNKKIKEERYLDK